MKLMTLECPKCNAQLEVNATLTQATCNYCGFRFLIDSEVKQVNINMANSREEMAAFQREQLEIQKQQLEEQKRQTAVQNRKLQQIEENIREPEQPETAEENHSGSNMKEDEILTVENCDDLAELLSTSNDENTKAFAIKYKGRQIEFDGYVADVINYSSGSTIYKTRFNYLIYVGDCGQEHFTGPSIQFINVTYNSFNFAGDTPDSVPIDRNLHIIAEVIEFKEQQGLLILKPVSTKVR